VDNGMKSVLIVPVSEFSLTDKKLLKNIA